MSHRQIAAGWVLPTLLAFGLVLGLNGLGLANRPESPSLQSQLRKLRLIHDMVEKYYVDDVADGHPFKGAFQGYLQSLDPHSEYFDEDGLKDFAVDTEGQFGGIGIQVNMEDGWLTVVTPMEGTPAFRAGIQPGDKIVEIEGQNAEGITSSEAVKLLRGKPGTPVRLTILHRGASATEKVELVREIIQLKSIRGARMVDAKSGVGYVRITTFQDRTAMDLREAIERLTGEGMKALVLDLRLNGGGLLTEAVETANLFVKQGIIVSTRGRMDEDNRTEIADPAKTLPEFPVAVLVNGSTASASEIVAGALQDHKRGLVIGSRTYGKGSVQTVLQVPGYEDCAVKMTTARYYTPSGRCIDRRLLRSQAEMENIPLEQRNTVRDELLDYGIAPDIEADLPEDQLDELMESFQSEAVHPPNGKDPAGSAATAPKPPAGEPFVDVQLQRAKDVLAALLAIKK